MEATARAPDQIQADVIAHLRRVSEIRHESGRQPRAKPLLGGPFGSGGYSICSLVFVEAGLDVAVYHVRADSCGFLLGSSEEKAEAISHARTVLRRIDPFRLQQAMQDFLAWKERFDAESREQRVRAWEEHRKQVVANLPPSIRSIPKRRQRIFEEGGGKCHYCSAPLTLDGKWHIEHKHPRALGGGNEPGNLVASCVPCNMKKRDTTDVEFKARIAKEKAA